MFIKSLWVSSILYNMFPITGGCKFKVELCVLVAIYVMALNLRSSMGSIKEVEQDDSLRVASFGLQSKMNSHNQEGVIAQHIAYTFYM